MNSALVVFVVSAAYATLRYNVCADVPWGDWPTVVLNKILALAALAILALHAIRNGRRKEQGSAHPDLLIGAFLAAVHGLLSLILLSPAYYEKLFVLDRFTASAGIGMLFGALAAGALLISGKLLTDPRAPSSQLHFGVLSFLVGLHAAFQGFFGWFTPWKWPCGMPPITLISFLLGVISLVSVAVRKPAEPAQKEG